MILKQPQESVSSLHELIFTQHQGFDSVSMSLAVRVNSEKAASLCKTWGWFCWHWLENARDGMELSTQIMASTFGGIEINVAS